MAIKRINGRNGFANVSIGGVDYKTVLRRFSVESNVGMDDVTVFSTEAAPQFEPQIETLRWDIMGFNTYDSAESGPLIPAPQNVALVFTYFTGCTISGTGNSTRATATREVGTNSMISAEGVITGAFVVAWDVTGA